MGGYQALRNPMMGEGAIGGTGTVAGGSSNQYFPVMPSFANPGQATSPANSTRQLNPYGNQGYNPYQVPTQGPSAGSPISTKAPIYSGQSGGGAAGRGPMLKSGAFNIEQSQDPQLTNALFNYLQSQVGQGVSPFNLSTVLPTGGVTAAGQLTLGENPLLSQLMNFFQGGGGSSVIPGANTLSTIANQGISALPEWQAMIAAQQQNIAQNEANLKEQFGSMGNLAGSPFGTAVSNFEQQTTLDQNALLGQLQQQNILQGQIPVAQALLGGAGQFGQYGQQLDQQAIQNMYQEFIRTSPQYNPLLGYQFGGATTYAPFAQNPEAQHGGGFLGGLLGGLGSLASGFFGGGKV